MLGFLPSPAGYDARTEQFSQELRLSSKSASIAGIATTWTAGLYYANQRRRFLDDEYIPGLRATFQQIYGYGIYSNASVVGPSYYTATAAYPAESFANDLIYFGHIYPKQQQIAPFGELGFEITPALKGAIGLRYVSARSSELVDSGGFYSYGLPATYSVNQKFSATTPKFSLEYAINPSSNLYATIAKGFRLGGPTGPVPAFQPNGPPPATPGTCGDFVSADRRVPYLLSNRTDRRLRPLEPAIRTISLLASPVRQTHTSPTRCGATSSAARADI